ncbi:MAG: hypothetical protein H6712_09080 [Myxococcales bacterium]|nr:hypothetical protein [Myxococcales bacterium]MCB9713994.1 hypothetical protein [Myxococcales bacterium]
MLSLPQVLHEAQRHSVTEIAIEPGQPVTFHGEQGALVLGDPLDEGEISDALTQVLAPDQMADLAVASMVEFHLEGYAEWDLVAETGVEGVAIRGRIRDGSTPEEYGVPLDLPPLRHFDELTSELPRASVTMPMQAKEPGETRWDINAIDGVVMQEVPRAPSGAIEDPTLRPTTGERPPLSVFDDPYDDSDLSEDEGIIDFALVGRNAPTADLPGVDPSLVSTAPRVRAPEPRGTRPTMRGDDTLAMHIDSLTPGTVVYLAGVGAGPRLLEHFEAGYEVIDDGSWATVTTRPLAEIPMGQAYLVRLEDPSRCLSWLLRRLEEGGCVVMETRARTAAGARRLLLGAEATPHVVGWLDAHRQLWLHADGRAWLLEPLGTGPSRRS